MSGQEIRPNTKRALLSPKGPPFWPAVGIVLASAALFACDRDQHPAEGSGTNAAETETTEIVVYSGRSEALVGPVLAAFEEHSGIDVRVNYADSVQLAATLLEEGDVTPADVFIAQDASTLALLESQGVLGELPAALVEQVGPQFRSRERRWVGVTGRARTLAYNTEVLTPDTLPSDLAALTAPEWRGRIGWSPENASFQSFVAAMIQLVGEAETQTWLAGVQANEPRSYPNNTTLVTGVGRGEVDVGLTNHYYLYRLRGEFGDDFPVENFYFRDGNAGALVNLSGVGVTAHSANREAAIQLVTYLLSAEAQAQFSGSNFEFPLAAGVSAVEQLPAIGELNAPAVDLAALSELETTQRLLREVGVLR